MENIPHREVIDNRIYSPALPPTIIQVNPAFTYVGSSRFILYGIAHAEQHLFVVAGPEHSVERLVWIQFEGYLPDNQKAYNYPPSETIILGPFEFLHNTFVMDIDAAIRERPDSDGAHVVDFLESRGYRWRGAVVSERFVHLVGDDKRNELMIIYSEDLLASGFQVSDFEAVEDGGVRGREVAQAVHERALSSFTILPA
jgi:hypothetical protein